MVAILSRASLLFALIWFTCAGPPPLQGETRERETAVSDRKDSTARQPLTPDEAAELQKRAEEPGPEVTGGALSNEHLTYIVIALAAAVIVLIAK
jgi:hypothetical protein